MKLGLRAVSMVLLLLLGCAGCAYFNPGPAPRGGSDTGWQYAPETTPGAWQNQG